MNVSMFVSIPILFNVFSPPPLIFFFHYEKIFEYYMHDLLQKFITLYPLITYLIVNIPYRCRAKRNCL